jgi:hypothetical protein
MLDDIIIYEAYGGLGDNLQFSTLPELYARAGHDVYISNRNKPRNQGIHDLVLGCNPFVKGLSDKTPNCGHAVPYFVWPLVPPPIISFWEESCGFGVVNKFPRVYYSPVIREDFRERVLVDLGFTSNNFESNETRELARNILSKNFKRREWLEVEFGGQVSVHHLSLGGDRVRADSIFDYCDLIASCYGLVTVYSGASVLASALKQDAGVPNVFVIKHSRDGGGYVFDNLTYVNLD